MSWPRWHSDLWTCDGDPLETVFAHQVLEGQLQFDLTLARGAGIGSAIGHWDLLQRGSRTTIILLLITIYLQQPLSQSSTC